VVKGDVQGLKLKELFPTLKTMEEALGTLYGRIDVTGQGGSVAELLGSGNGHASFAVQGGRVSELLLQLVELDLADVVMLLGTKNKQAQLRCSVAGFDMKDGLARAESFVVDTEDALIKVEGTVSLKDETVDLEAHPYPKDPSLFSLRSPILIQGPLKKPKARPKAGPIAARVAAAVGLAAINPALAALALMDAGPGKDADCARLLAEARSRGAVKKTQ
jgi:uncharacterized protein involved in outer membrane biogenesis